MNNYWNNKRKRIEKKEIKLSMAKDIQINERVYCLKKMLQKGEITLEQFEDKISGRSL